MMRKNFMHGDLSQVGRTAHDVLVQQFRAALPGGAGGPLPCAANACFGPCTGAV